MADQVFIAARGLHAHYGQSHILHGVDLRIARGEAVGLLGRNGMGKTTLIRTLLGQVPATQGSVHIDGREVTRQPTERIVLRGIGVVPEGRGVFPNRSTRENLLMAARPGVRGQYDWTFERVLTTFPRLAERLSHGGGQLSGGEQQMLAIGRALMSKPKLLLLDEPSLGLAPIIIQQIFDIIEQLRKDGVTVFLVEQNANQALKLADRGYVLENGRIVMQGSGHDLLNDPKVRDAYLGG